MADEKIEIVGRSSGQVVGRGFVILSKISKHRRVQKAVRNIAICWALMIAGAFVPMLHFIFVPGFFLLGLFMAANGYVDDIEISSGEYVCAKCSSPVALARHDDQWPIWSRCETCKVDVGIEKSTP